MSNLLRNRGAIAAAIGFALTLGPVSASYAWTSDNGNGTFSNPVLYGDYPDPDIVRVGDDYYLATSTFALAPGIEILHSKDLINWGILGYALSSLDFDPKFNMVGGTEYGGGVWAPSLRYHNGVFYVLDNIQPLGLAVCRATNPAGPWKVNKLDTYLYDPGLMFDDDGTPLIFHGTGGHISVAVLNSDLTKVLSSTPAYTIKDGEGSHAYKINGMYYIFNSVYGSDPVLLCSRSKSRTGPFETVTVCNNNTPWSGPHQGGIVQMAGGGWWGFSLVDSGPVGRDLWEGPVQWRDGWPYFGDPAKPSIPTTNAKPIAGKFKVKHPATSDEFTSSKLALQWQWNHNPDNTKWSLSSRPGYLRLYTQTAANYSNARNTITQRTEGQTSRAVIKIDTSHLKPGDRTGLSLLEQYFGYVAVYKDVDSQRIVRVINKNGKLDSPSEDITDNVPNVAATILWLQVQCDFGTQKAQFSYSTNGTEFTPIGGDFPMHFTLATFQGERFGIFNYNTAGSNGWLDVDYFHEEKIHTESNSYEK